MISDENIFMLKLCVTSNEHTPNEVDDKNKDKDGKFMNDDNWIQLKKCMTLKYFFKHTKLKKRLRRIMINISC